MIESESMRKITWQEKAIGLEKVHKAGASRSPDSYGIRDTARLLNLSVGSVSEDLQLAIALRIYPQLEKIKTRKEALAFVRKRRKVINGKH